MALLLMLLGLIKNPPQGWVWLGRGDANAEESRRASRKARAPSELAPKVLCRGLGGKSFLRGVSLDVRNGGASRLAPHTKTPAN